MPSMCKLYEIKFWLEYITTGIATPLFIQQNSYEVMQCGIRKFTL